MINAYAVKEAGDALEPYSYDPGEIGAHEVEVDVSYCGMCHSDLSMINNEWGMSEYPLVPGHEVVGVISAVGAHVTDRVVGQKVGLGWHAGYCMTCSDCMTGDHNLCDSAVSTVMNKGGFADKVRAHSPSTIPIPDELPLSKVGPLLCGGITVFNPLFQYSLKPTSKVGVIGIGGLGHLALQFLKAWGCEVTAFTSSESKAEQAKEFGAHKVVDSTSDEALEACAGTYDFIISTVNVSLNWNLYVNALKSKGRLHLVGAALEPLDLGAFPLIMKQRVVSGSPVGSPETIAQMLEFCARHEILPKVEEFPLDQCNEAIKHLHEGKARYRIVLKVAQ